MRALVTGSNGFIGSFLVEKLIQENYSVRCLVRRTSNLRWIEHLDIELCYGELSDPESLCLAVHDVDIVFHLGGLTRGFKEQDYINGNVVTTQNLLNACQNDGPDHLKFVFISSQAAGGPSYDGRPLDEKNAQYPISMYGRSKYMAEEAVWQFSKSHAATIIRPPSVYGPRDSDFHSLFKSAKRGFAPVVGGGQQRISIIHVQDLVEGIFLAGTNPKANGELFFICSDEDVSFSDLAEKISAAVGAKSRLINIPLFLVRLVVTASTVGAIISNKPSILNKDKYIEMKQPAWLCSNAKAKGYLGFRPSINLVDGLQETAQWYVEHGWL